MTSTDKRLAFRMRPKQNVASVATEPARFMAPLAVMATAVAAAVSLIGKRRALNARARDLSMNDFDIGALAQANNQVYMTAYKIGYEAGWQAALAKAAEIIKAHPEPPASTSAKPGVT